MEQLWWAPGDQPGSTHRSRIVFQALSLREIDWIYFSLVILASFFVLNLKRKKILLDIER